MKNPNWISGGFKLEVRDKSKILPKISPQQHKEHTGRRGTKTMIGPAMIGDEGI